MFLNIGRGRSLWGLVFVGLMMLPAPTFGIFALVPAERVREIPVTRLLTNLDRNAAGLSPAERARAVGRVHLLASLRSTTNLPVYATKPYLVAEGRIDDCTALDGWLEVARFGPFAPPVMPSASARCEERVTSLEPRPEVPRSASPERPDPDAHLAAALSAYTQAKQLDPSNLRTRVALAFVYDRHDLRVPALEELRFVAGEGLRRIPPPASGQSALADWETHVVVSEGAQHLAQLASSQADTQLARAVRVRLDAVPPTITVTPIFVPLSASVTFEAAIDRQSTVVFDFSGQGLPIQAGWLTPRAAWLVWDPQGRGEISGGFQLFGSVTWMAFWDNGFRALGTLDDDGDGRLTGDELKGLALWHDVNTNGRSERGEVVPLSAHGIVALHYAHVRLGEDAWMSVRGVTLVDGSSRPLYDWIVRAAAPLRSDSF